jgi:hypothetical protein
LSKKLLSRDAVTGKETWVHDNADGGFIFESSQNVDALLKQNKEEANAYRAGGLIGNTQKHHQKVAEIPTALYYELIQKFGEPKQNPTAWKKWLNEYDNRFFRTSGGNV